MIHFVSGGMSVNQSEYTVIQICCVVVVSCQPGKYLLDGLCYTDCPFTYYPVNVTSVSEATGLPPVNTVTGVCSRCNSVGVCARLFRLQLTVAGAVACIVLLAVLVVCACLRGVCQRRPTNTSIDGIATAPLHSPRYITNGHIVAGLSTKPLLAGSDSDSSDESEVPTDLASVNNI